MDQPTIEKLAKKCTVKSVEKYLELQRERKELESKARQIANAENQLAACLREFAAENKNDVTKGKYRIRLIDQAGRVKWKDEFIAVAGEVKANKLVAAAPKTQKLEVA